MHRPALVLMLLCGAVPALAANAKATALSKDAEKLYKENQYKEAAELLKQAYEADPVPKFVYNMARAWDQAGDLSPAMEAYRKYVALPSEDTDPDLVKKANLAMDRIRTLLAKDEATLKIQSAEKDRLENDAREARARADEEKAKAKKQKDDYEAREKASRDAATKRQNLKKYIAYGCAGGAAVGLGMSLGFGLGAGGTKTAFTSATTVQEKQQLESSTRTFAAVADVGLVVGLGAAVAAIILYPKGAEADVAVSVSLAPMPGGGLATLGGSF